MANAMRSFPRIFVAALIASRKEQCTRLQMRSSASLAELTDPVRRFVENLQSRSPGPTSVGERRPRANEGLRSSPNNRLCLLASIRAGSYGALLQVQPY